MPPGTSKGTKKRAASKPGKPHKDFPLFAHATRRWAKKVRGKLVYFGPWDDPQAALERWLEQKDDLLAGRTPRVKQDGLTLAELVNRFLTAKRDLVDNGELAVRSWADYHATGQNLVAVFGRDRLVDDLASDDFDTLRRHLAKTRGPVSLGNEIQRVRMVFKYGYDAGLIDKPMRYGPGFKRPTRKVLRLERAKRGAKLFEAAEILAMLDAAGTPLRAMILLAINAGLGNGDVGNLEQRHLDLVGGWLNYPRPKTGVGRRCRLWPETIAAIQESIDHRPTPKADADKGLVFVTKYGLRWTRETRDNPVSKEMAKLFDALGIDRTGRGFYAIRHTFRTIADETRDQPAIDHCMGHTDPTMGGHYRERIDDSRLEAVADHVRLWLWPEAKPRRRKAR